MGAAAKREEKESRSSGRVTLDANQELPHRWRARPQWGKRTKRPSLDLFIVCKRLTAFKHWDEKSPLHAALKYGMLILEREKASNQRQDAHRSR